MRSGLDFLCFVELGENSLRSKSEWVAGESDCVSQVAKALPQWCLRSVTGIQNICSISVWSVLPTWKVGSAGLKQELQNKDVPHQNTIVEVLSQLKKTSS